MCARAQCVSVCLHTCARLCVHAGARACVCVCAECALVHTHTGGLRLQVFSVSDTYGPETEFPYAYDELMHGIAACASTVCASVADCLYTNVNSHVGYALCGTPTCPHPPTPTHRGTHRSGYARGHPHAHAHADMRTHTLTHTHTHYTHAHARTHTHRHVDSCTRTHARTHIRAHARVGAVTQTAAFACASWSTVG